PRDLAAPDDVLRELARPLASLGGDGHRDLAVEERDVCEVDVLARIGGVTEEAGAKLLPDPVEDVVGDGQLDREREDAAADVPVRTGLDRRLVVSIDDQREDR